MNNSLQRPRLYALDGIRGIAILLVVLNHLPAGVVQPFLPSFMYRSLFSGGITGVSLLFILSGFLMAYIYPNPKSAVGFWQQRYTRIFPLFITLCTVVAIVRLLPNLPWYVILTAIFASALIMRVLWVHVLRPLDERWKKWLFIGFLGLQLGTALWYSWLLRHPAIVLNQQLPALVRETTIGLVNGTLTMPLGNYIPLLDGVYWSLAAEVFFYLLYPIVCAPLIHALANRSRRMKWSILILSLPFFGGLSLLFQHIGSLSMLQVYLSFYFVTGMALGHLYRIHQDWFQRITLPFVRRAPWLWLAVLLLALAAKSSSFGILSANWDIWIHLFWSIPLTLIIGLALVPQSGLQHSLENKSLVWLGTISYSIYLTHAVIIQAVEKILLPISPAYFLMFFGLVAIFTLIVSAITYRLVEKPYYTRNKTSTLTTNTGQIRTRQFPRVHALIFASFIVFCVSLFSAYQSNFNFFSQLIPLQTTSSPISMDTAPQVDLQFTSPENNLQLLSMHLTHLINVNKKPKGQVLLFRIKEEGTASWYAQNSYDLAMIGDSTAHLFGFPLIQDARGKVFTLQLALTDPTSADYLVLYPESLSGNFKVDKRLLISHPAQLASFTWNRIQIVAANREAQTVVALMLPLLVILSVSIKHKPELC